jgi:hypothetical protein
LIDQYTVGSRKAASLRWYLRIRKNESNPVLVEKSILSPPKPLLPETVKWGDTLTRTIDLDLYLADKDSRYQLTGGKKSIKKKKSPKTKVNDDEFWDEAMV